MSIRLNNISKSYGELNLFHNYSVTIKENKITCIMGPSGVGKTTFLHILLGLEKIDSGKIEGLEGKTFTAVFQEDRLIKNMDSIKNVQLVCKNKISKESLVKEFAQVGLKGFEDKPVYKLSGGMKRRVAIVRAVVPESDIIIMDEPFKGLDKNLKKKVIQYVKAKTIGKTVIIVTHDLDEIKELDGEKLVLLYEKLS